MRLFFAVPVGSDTAMAIADWRDRAANCAGKPVPCANFHLTLAFIGETAPARLQSICEAADRQLAEHDACGGVLHMNNVGYWSRPGIFWLGLKTCPGPLAALASALRRTASAAGTARSRKPFVPHISLYRRCETPPPAPLVQPDFKLVYDEICLFETKQQKAGVGYQALERWQLN